MVHDPWHETTAGTFTAGDVTTHLPGRHDLRRCAPRPRTRPTLDILVLVRANQAPLDDLSMPRSTINKGHMPPLRWPRSLPTGQGIRIRPLTSTPSTHALLPLRARPPRHPRARTPRCGCASQPNSAMSPRSTLSSMPVSIRAQATAPTTPRFTTPHGAGIRTPSRRCSSPVPTPMLETATGPPPSTLPSGRAIDSQPSNSAPQAIDQCSSRRLLIATRP